MTWADAFSTFSICAMFAAIAWAYAWKNRGEGRISARRLAKRVGRGERFGFFEKTVTHCPCPKHPLGCFDHPEKCGCNADQSSGANNE